jgi:sarcosine oxidase subunit alpha
MDPSTASSNKLLRLSDVSRDAPFKVLVDGHAVDGYPGETVAAVLIASGKRVFSYAPDGSPRSYSCGIGRCFSCLVTIDGIKNVRTCCTLAREGMQIETGGHEGRL